MASPYTRFGVGISLNAIVVLFLAYALWGEGDDLYVNLNRIYLAITMVAPMVIALLLVMPSMHRSVAANYVMLGAFAALLVATLALARAEALLADEPFLTPRADVVATR